MSSIQNEGRTRADGLDKLCRNFTQKPSSRMVCCAIQSRWVGGTRHMTVAYEGWVFLRRLGCYGETAACMADRVGRNVRLG
jgi:hypothetical protein